MSIKMKNTMQLWIITIISLVLLPTVYSISCDMSDANCRLTCPDYKSEYMSNPLGLTGNDGCCGDDKTLFMYDAFNDYSYEWTLPASISLDAGTLSATQTTTSQYAHVVVPVTLNRTNSLTISFNTTVLDGLGYARVYMLDQNKATLYPVSGDLSVDCGVDYSSGHPPFVFLSACQPGITGASCPDGTHAKCEIRILDPALEIFYLNITLASSTYDDIRYDYFGVREGAIFKMPSSEKDDDYLVPDNKYTCNFTIEEDNHLEYYWQGWCGNGEIDANIGEVCDDGLQNGNPCTPNYGNTCSYCSTTCQLATLEGGSCGDGFCESPDETMSSCYADCGGIYGWHTTNNGWSINEEKKLVATTTTDVINIYSDAFELRLDSEYVLEANITNPNACTVVIDLNDGGCLSRTDWLQHPDCFADTGLSATGAISFQTPESSNHASQGFFKNVSVRIRVDTGCSEVKFDNISFKEVSPIDPYHELQPSINATTACCPQEYCWDGSQCVLSNSWNLSNNSNLWSMLSIDGQIYSHINTSMQWLARGYRCALNESGYADWEAAEIKYDWDFEESGYCIRDTDCFVSQTFGGVDLSTKQGFIDSFSNGGSSCIRNGQFINDDYGINLGNHYCLDGKWTTKTFLIANVLENITSGKPYIIFCDDTGKIFNSIENTKTSQNENNISGGCVLISKEDDEERIITGFYVADPFENDMMCQLYLANHNLLNPENMLSECIDGFPLQYGDCTPLPNGAFRRCVSDTNFVLYINNNSFYYLLSNNPLPEIENSFFYNLWNSIVSFFQRLFGYTPQEPLGLARQTQNYGKIYILSNNTLKVSAVEEKKYDEELVKKMVYMYLNMTGQDINSQDNKFNIEFVNRSIGGVYYTFNESSTSRILVVKYNYPAELWPYLTAMLRDRS